MVARLTPLLAVAALLLFATPALADELNVTSGVDSIETSCTEVGGTGSGSWDCTSLRAAAAKANSTPALDFIELAPRVYSIDLGEIAISQPVDIIGGSPRTTTIQGDGESRLFNIAASAANVAITHVTLTDGAAPGDDGGNILNAADLVLDHVHVTQGVANRGGGIATTSTGTTVVIWSLVDGNRASSTGGGLFITGPIDNPENEVLGVEASTVASNTAELGAGIAANGEVGVTLLSATVAANHGAGILQAGGADEVVISGSIVAANEGANCQTNLVPQDSGGNIDDHNTCGFGRDSTGSLHDADPRLAAAVSNQGGLTDVLPITAGSPAIDLVRPCLIPIDQRDVQRTGSDEDEPCDAGAFELTPGSNQSGGSAPAILAGTSSSPDGNASFAFSGTGSFECRLDGPTSADIGTFTACTSPKIYTGLKPGIYVFHVRSSAGETTRQFSVAPPATPAQVAPTPSPAPTPTPVPQQDATGKVVSGIVLIKLPGGKFAPFDPSKPIPSGAEIDVTKGKIELTALVKKGGKPEKATFYDGIFKLTLGKKTTDLTLSQPLAPCKRGAAAAAKKPKTRKLWGDGSGSFRTRGQYSAATVRGTTWLVQDSCAGTLTKVTKGAVSVFDQVKKRTIVLRAGKQYLAKPRR